QFRCHKFTLATHTKITSFVRVQRRFFHFQYHSILLGKTQPHPEGLYSANLSGVDLRPRWGRSAYARFLHDEKSGKESLRAFPPKDLPGVRGWTCGGSQAGPKANAI